MADVSIVFVGAEDQEGKDGPFYLTSTRGWVEFGKWVKTLPKKLYSSLRELASDGRSENTLELGLELSDIPEDCPDAAKGIIAGLVEVVGVGDDSETAVIVTDDEDE